MAVKQTPLVVLTDLEPDDMLALAVLAGRPDVDVQIVVAGEGNVAAKLERLKAASFVRSACQPVMLAGCASARLSPGEVPCTLPEFDTSAFLKELEDTVMDNDGNTVVLLVLKPPQELIACMAQCPDRARAVFRAMHCALYGSYNIRACSNGSADWLLRPDTPFAKTYLFESFGGFANKSSVINASNAPAVLAVLESPSAREYYKSILRFSRVWDEDVVRDCDATCAAIASGPLCTSPEAAAAWERNDRCRRLVRAHLGRQFVAADPVLATVLLQPAFDGWLEPVSWTREAGSVYPTIARRDAADTASGLWMYRNMDWTTFVDACVATLV
jgi:hypothetical protein